MTSEAQIDKTDSTFKYVLFPTDNISTFSHVKRDLRDIKYEYELYNAEDEHQTFDDEPYSEYKAIIFPLYLLAGVAGDELSESRIRVFGKNYGVIPDDPDVFYGNGVIEALEAVNYIKDYKRKEDIKIAYFDNRDAGFAADLVALYLARRKTKTGNYPHNDTYLCVNTARVPDVRDIEIPVKYVSDLEDKVFLARIATDKTDDAGADYILSALISALGKLANNGHVLIRVESGNDQFNNAVYCIVNVAAKCFQSISAVRPLSSNPLSGSKYIALSRFRSNARVQKQLKLMAEHEPGMILAGDNPLKGQMTDMDAGINRIRERKIKQAHELKELIENHPKKNNAAREIIQKNIEFSVSFAASNGLQVSDEYSKVPAKFIKHSKYIDILFKKEEGIDTSKLKIRPESIFSVTYPWLADFIKESLEENIKLRLEDTIITDATANVGGDTISFAKYFRQVNSVEIDELTCSALKNNVAIYRRGNVDIRCGDFMKIADEIEQDIIYFDPPWGGPNYYLNDKVMLKLGEIPIYDIINERFAADNSPKYIVVKTPRNFDVEEFKDAVTGAEINVIDHNVILLIICRKL